MSPSSSSSWSGLSLTRLRLLRMRLRCSEVGAFYWTVAAPDIVNPGREELGSVSV